jgi:drug/metabolite transporter (DMT)-like permease
MIGEIAALVAAGIWAFSAIAYDRVLVQINISGALISLYRGLISLPFFILSLLLFDPVFPILTGSQWLFLGVSAILGITVGDTAFFLSLQYVGVRKALLLQTLTPLFSAIFAWLFLQEQISIYGLWGIPLTLLGLVWVISERATAQPSIHLLRGTMLGIFSCATQGLGAILLKSVLNNSDLTSLWSSSLRMAFGTILLSLWLLYRKEISFSLLSIPQWRWIVSGAFGGSFIGLWLHQTAFQFAPVGVASTLLTTSPLFSLGISLSLKEQISGRAIVGALITVIGISLLFIE